jgi:hypothetical protein
VKLCELPGCGDPVIDSRCRFCSIVCWGISRRQEIPPCGNPRKYQNHGCRCDLCRAAHLARVNSYPAAIARRAKVRAREIEIIAEVRAARALGAVRDSKELAKAQRKSTRLSAGEYDAWKWETRFARLVDPDYYRGIRQPLRQSTLSEFA